MWDLTYSVHVRTELGGTDLRTDKSHSFALQNCGGDARNDRLAAETRARSKHCAASGAHALRVFAARWRRGAVARKRAATEGNFVSRFPPTGNRLE